MTGDRVSTTNVVVEVLVQSVANARRKPKPRNWRTAGFDNFTPGHLSVTLPLPTGTYAVKYRFVNATTGQESATASLPAVEAG